MFDGFVKSPQVVTPAKAGVHKLLKGLDPRLRGDDKNNTINDFLQARQY